MHQQSTTIYSKAITAFAVAVIACGYSGQASADTAPREPELVQEALMIPARDVTPARFRRMPAPGSGLQDSDYLPIVKAASRGLTMHFVKMPIPIYVDASGQPELMQICQAGLNNWSLRSHYLVRFVLVPTAQEARVQVRFHHQGFNASGTPRAAVTHLDWRLKPGRHSNSFGGADLNDSAYFVPPQVIDINLDVAQDRTPEQRTILLTNIFSHEIGHALGMLGHSTVESDLQFKETDEYSRLSERDLNTLNKLYQTKADVQL